MIRLLWFTLGLSSLLLGTVGVITPLLPTVPFVLLAAFCFARSSERVHDWLLSHRTFGPMIVNWREKGAIGPMAKRLSTVSIMAVFAISLALRVPPYALALQALVLCGVMIFIWTRPNA